jgi:hypothetical protein
MYVPWYLRTWCPRKSKPLSTQVMTVFSCESFQPAFPHELLHAGFDLTFQQLFRGAGDDEVVGIPDHVHLAAIGCLAGWLGELLLEPAFKTIQCEVGQDWGGYTSYKVANLPIEFSSNIPRAHLRPGYGDGFRGAPLETGPRVSAPLGGSKEAVMARRERLRPTALTVHSTFEPSRGTPACVARAYECVVPMPRRPVAESPPAHRPTGEGGTQPGGRRKAS